MKDLRVVFNQIISQWGIDILLQRRIYRTGNGLYSKPLPDPNDYRYWSPQLEKHTVRMTFAGRRLSLSDTMEARPEGWIHTIPVLFYFSHDANPAEGDRIYVRDERFPDNLTTFIVTYSSAEYGRFGELAYYTVGSIRETTK